MKYFVYDSRYETGKDVNAMYGTNDFEEAVKAADDAGGGTIVVKRDEDGERSIYVAPYKSDLGISE